MVKTTTPVASAAMMLFLVGSSCTPSVGAMTSSDRAFLRNTSRGRSKLNRLGDRAFIRPFLLGGGENDSFHHNHRLARVTEQQKKRAEERKRVSKKIDQALIMMKESQQDPLLPVQPRRTAAWATPAAPAAAAATATATATATPIANNSDDIHHHHTLIQSLMETNQYWMDYAKKMIMLTEQQQLKASNNNAEIEFQFSTGTKLNGKFIAKGFTPSELQKFGKIISVYYVLPICFVSLLMYCLFK